MSTSFLKQLMRETAAAGVTAAHDAGGHGGHETPADYGTGLYRGGTIDPHKAKKKQKKKKNKIMSYDRRSEKNMTFQNMLRRQIPGTQMNEDQETEFDPASVISKLDSAEKRADVDQDTATFGLKNDEGQIVEVKVRAEQAEEFEKALQSMLSQDSEDTGGGEQTTANMEIAEVLYELRGRFEIVDVEWPRIEGDEQQEQEVEVDDEQDQGGEGDEEIDVDQEDLEAGKEDDEDEDKEDDEDEDSEEDEDEEMTRDESDQESQLQAVIDLLRQQAEAQKADAEAREAEAEREEAKYAAKAAAAKVKQEEDVLDMEAWEEKKKKADDEAKKLAKLAKYKHEKKDDEGDKKPSKLTKSSEQQEMSVDDDDEDEELEDTIPPEELADRIRHYLKSAQ